VAENGQLKIHDQEYLGNNTTTRTERESLFVQDFEPSLN